MQTISYDVETTGLDYFKGAAVFSYSTCDEQGRIQVHRLDNGSTIGRRCMERVWSDRSTAKVMHNAKFDLTGTERLLGKSTRGHTVHCTHKMSHIVQNNHPSHSLEDLSWDLAEYPRDKSKIRKLAKKAGGFDKVSHDVMDAYQRADAERGMLLYLFFWPKIQAKPEWREIYDCEMELIYTTMAMENRGVRIHPQRTQALMWELEKKADHLRKEMSVLAGGDFNPGSDERIREILYGKFGLPVTKKTETTRRPSVDKHVLMSLREKHPFIDKILAYRSFTKGVTTLDNYLDAADADGVIHPQINTCGAITGRQSCSNPNLQNVSKSKVLLNPFPIPARRCFCPRPGYVNLHIDYSGIEMRLIVHYAGEEEMVRCMRDGDGDVHALAADAFYGTRFREAVGEGRGVLRSAAKNANFATPYGAGADKVSQTLGLAFRQGFAAFARYSKRFPKLVSFSRGIAEDVRKNGFILTTFGRQLYVPQSEAYVGANYLIQGTAAEILKRASNRVHEYNEKATGGEVRLLLSIHDELVIEYPRDRMADLPGYLREIRKLMIDFPQFRVPLDIEAAVTTVSWEEKRKLKIPA